MRRVVEDRQGEHVEKPPIKLERRRHRIGYLDEIEPSALWADSKLGFDLAVRHHDQWERSAIVTDIDWMAHATRLFAWMIPGEARVFQVAELERAKAWVSGGAG